MIEPGLSNGDVEALIEGGVSGAEAAEDNFFEGSVGVLGDEVAGGGDGDVGGGLFGEAVDTGGDGGEGDGPAVVLDR